MDHVTLARQQIEWARGYTLTMLEDVDEQDWFRMPAGSATHIAWQVGHLAMAEYGLTMFRLRGRRDEDALLMSGSFRKLFSKGSTPNPDPAHHLPPKEIRAIFDRVHAQAMQELLQYQDQDLQEAVEMPYSVFPNKLGALFFCAAHEMLHAGQIGLLRRSLGKPPLR